MSSTADRKPVLILGGGINGAAIARELVLNDQPVWLVESHDFAAGSTAYSSRLIHGGLRYLEFAEFDLVRESLGERRRLLELAPDFVQPLELYIPVRSRFGGMWQSLSRFCGFGGPSSSSRGLWVVGCGLWFYDLYANDPSLPKHKVHRAAEETIRGLNEERFRWLCSYWDGQIASPERFVVALLKDAAKVADEAGLEFRVLNYHEACLEGAFAQVVPTAKHADATSCELYPAAIINCTGAWVDNTLQKLEIKSEQLIGGTKGSHLFTWNDVLRERLGGRGIYVEARDGRPIFILPLRGGALIGTTDIHFQGDPAQATTSDQEIEYLLDAVNEVFEGSRLGRNDIAWHYSGVRPLPYVDHKTTAGITRRHGLHEHTGCEVPFYSVIGGKLTTCRSLAEEVTQRVLPKLGMTVAKNSRERRIEDSVLGAPTTDSEDTVAGTRIPVPVAEECINSEWVRRLEDLVERRLMLLYDRELSYSTLEQLANLMVRQGKLSDETKADVISQYSKRLKEHFGLEL